MFVKANILFNNFIFNVFKFAQKGLRTIEMGQVCSFSGSQMGDSLIYFGNETYNEVGKNSQDSEL